MTETEGETVFQEGTPCLITRSKVDDNGLNHQNRGRIPLHDRSDPCGQALRGDDPPIPTFVEFVEEAAEGRVYSPEPCRGCGGSL